MANTLTSLTDLAALGFDDIIDVRAPAEFAEDRLPGAISLPVLSDEERARVGTIYKQVNPFTARKLGVPTVICGPGSMAQGHKPDEYVSGEQMARCEAMLAALVERLVGGI